MKMRRIIAVAFLLMVAPCLAQDADASKREKVEEMLIASHSDATFTRIIDMVKLQLQQTTSQSQGMETMTEEQKKVYEKFQSDVMSLTMASVSWNAIKPEMVKLWMENFTEQQIEDITAFYKSSTGQALLEKQPQLMGQIAQFTQARMADLQPKLAALTEQFEKDIAAASPDKKPN